MKMHLRRFNIVYRARPEYRAKLLAVGNVTDTHFEIEDEKLRSIGNIDVSLRTPDAQQKPCTGGDNPPMPTATQMEEPTMQDMVENFSKAMVTWAAAGFPLVTKEISLERAETCEGNAEKGIAPCPLWQANARRIPFTNKVLGKCTSKKCGCSKVKWWLATSQCPEQNWKR